MYDELRAIQNAEFYILKEIKRVCDKNDIKYFLTGGTMLGAIRHKGFIPWDDDVDIAMVKEEYDKFLSIAQTELGEEFFLDNLDTNNDCALVFSKVRLLGTEFVELKGNSKASHNEFFVDIFPYLYLPEDEKERNRLGNKMILLSQLLLCKSGYRVWEGEGGKKALKFLPIRVLCLFMSKSLIQKLISATLNQMPLQSAITGPNNGAKSGYKRWLIPRKVFDNYIQVEFEGEQFPVPEDYETCLRTFYGNSFMELPPEEKRKTHRPVKLNFGKYSF